MSTHYSPFDCPPNFERSSIHRQACKIQNKSSPTRGYCECCRQQIYKEPMPFCTSIKELNFLGAEIPLLFFFMENIILLVILTVCVGTGEFVFCSMQSTCQIDLMMKFQLGSWLIKIPVGYIDHGDSQLINVLVLAVYTLVFALLQIRLRRRTGQMQMITHANLCVLLSNVSKKATKREIQELFFENDHPASGVYLIKKMRPWLEVMKHKSKLKKQLLKAQSKRENQALGHCLSELMETDEKLSEYYRLSKDDLKFRTQYVIVRLMSEESRDAFIKKTRMGFIKSTFFRICGCCSPFQLHNQHIRVIPAPPPKDIFWQNLQVNRAQTVIKRFVSTIVSFLLVLFSATGTIYLTMKQTTLLQGIIVSLFVQVFNIVIVEFIEWSAQFEEEITHTKEKLSLTMKLTFFQFLNVTIMPFLIFAYRVFQEQSGSRDEMLVLNDMTTSVGFIYVGNLVKPFLFMFSFERITKWLVRIKERSRGSKSELCQFEANKIFEPVPLRVEIIYSVILSSLLGTFFYLSIMPSLIAVQLTLLIIMLFAARYMLLRVCRQPSQYTSLLNRAATKVAQLSIIVFWIGKVMFKIMLSDKDKILKNLEKLWKDNLFKVEVGIISGYLLLFYILGLDERIGRWLGRHRRPTRDQLLERFGGTIIDMQYENAHSFVGLKIDEEEVQNWRYGRLPPMNEEESYPWEDQ